MTPSFSIEISPGTRRGENNVLDWEVELVPAEVLLDGEPLPHDGGHLHGAPGLEPHEGLRRIILLDQEFKGAAAAFAAAAGSDCSAPFGGRIRRAQMRRRGGSRRMEEE